MAGLKRPAIARCVGMLPGAVSTSRTRSYAQASNPALQAAATVSFACADGFFGRSVALWSWALQRSAVPFWSQVVGRGSRLADWVGSQQGWSRGGDRSPVRMAGRVPGSRCWRGRGRQGLSTSFGGAKLRSGLRSVRECLWGWRSPSTSPLSRMLRKARGFGG